MTRSILAAVAVVLAAAIPSSAAALSDAQEPSLGSYIVVLKPDAARSDASARSARPLVSTVAQELSRAHSADVTAVYQYALKGFAARLSADQADALTNDPRVEYVEQDQVFHTLATQTPATWGLDRVDQRDLPLNNTYTYNQTGQGVQAYIIDTGMRATHQQFTGRVGNGFTAINDGNGTNDCNGHGTHVAGTVGGTTYGIAKQVTLHAVRVLDCSGSGSNAGVIAGVDWVTQNHGSPAVANMSLGGGVSSALDQAVANSISSGVSYAIAAGNSNANACNSSPARVAVGQHGRCDDQHRRSLLVLQLRHVRRHLRAGLEHHLVLEHQRHRHEHDQRYVHGDSARGRCSRALSPDESGRIAGDGDSGADRQLDAEQGHEPRHRLPEPPAVHRSSAEDLRETPRRRRRPSPRRRTAPP